MSPFPLAILLGLRHATDPDHMTAVSTIVLGDRRQGVRRAAAMGVWWGIGHAVMLVALGLPVVLLSRELPPAVGRWAEIAAGLLIAFLALRLLHRWRRGYFHWHPHTHDGDRHSHPHFHERAPRPVHPTEHGHGHLHATPRAGRSLPAAFGVGLVHGAAGSAGASVLAVTIAPGAGVGVLLAFAGAVAVSMGASAAAIGWLITREPVSRTLPRLIPVLGVASLVFGLWWAGSAM